MAVPMKRELRDGITRRSSPVRRVDHALFRTGGRDKRNKMKPQNHVYRESCDQEEGYMTLCAPCSKRVDETNGEKSPDGLGWIQPYAFADAEVYSVCDVCQREP